MSYKFDSKEEALERFGSEIIKILKEANPESRPRLSKMFKKIKEDDIYSSKNSSVNYFRQLDLNRDPNDSVENDTIFLFYEIHDAVDNCLSNYIAELKKSDIGFLYTIALYNSSKESFTEDYLTFLEYFDYCLRKRAEKEKPPD